MVKTPIKFFFSLVTMTEANTMYYSSTAFSILKENTISSNQLRVISKLASGQFGRVYKGNNLLACFFNESVPAEPQVTWEQFPMLSENLLKVLFECLK